uniref:Uncharacterized protein n=1 Tax=Helianthus annuus TaxID=4232 RepID=A0A251SGV0_HELAN
MTISMARRRYITIGCLISLARRHYITNGCLISLARRKTIFSKRSFFFISFLNAFSLHVRSILAAVRDSASQAPVWRTPITASSLGDVSNIKIIGSSKFQIRIGSIPMLSLDSEDLGMCNCVIEIKHKS